MKTETIYVERANGQQEFWTYSEGQRVYLTRGRALDLLAQRDVRLIKVDA